MKNRTPIVSIIVPVYNGRKYISECLESIQKQDYSELDIIVVDDGSTDGSFQILDEFARKDNRIKVIKKENSGVSSARNIGMEIMVGDYVCFVDQDDCIAPDYVSYFLNLISNNGAEIAAVRKANRFVGQLVIKPVSKDEDAEIVSGHEAARQMLYYNFIIAPWNKMISTKLIRKHKLRFREELWGGEGFLFSVECFQRAAHVAVGEKKVYYYRCDNRDSGMTKFNEWIFRSSIKAQEIMKDSMIVKNKKMMSACEYASWHTNCDMLSYLVGCNAIKSHYDSYKAVKKVCRRKGRYAINAPISLKEKMKAIAYMISPDFTVLLINKFRLRKYTRE